jgi:Rod binding domain-containing protein
MTTPLSSHLIPPEAGASEVSRNAFQSRLAGLGKLGGANVSPEQKEKKLREACEGFESIFIQKMWEEMRKTLPKSTLLHGREEQFWQGMYDQELAKKLTSAGGIGLADMMYAQLSRSLGDASRATATDAAGAQPRAFVPEAAPMLPATAEPARAADAAAQDAENVASAAQRNRQAEQRGNAVVAAARQQPAPGNAPAAPAQQPAIRPDAIYEGEAPGAPQAGDAPSQRDSAQAAPAAPTAAAAGRPPHGQQPMPHAAHHPDIMNSGLTQARLAQFEAGSKLGPGAVRPSSRQVAGLGQASKGRAAAGQPQTAAAIPPLTAASLNARPDAASPAGQETAPSAQSAAPAAQPRMELGREVELSPQMRDMAETAVQMSSAIPGGGAAPRPSRVRYTTNIPPSGNRKGQKDLIRMLNTDAAGPNSKAGAGIAAYHAQQAGAAAARNGNAGPTQARPDAASALSSPSAAALFDGPAAQGVENPSTQDGRQILVRQSRRDADGAAAAAGIPPLTAVPRADS